MHSPGCVDDRDTVNDAEIIKIDWPLHIRKPKVGIVSDEGIYPRWTKYRRFLETNAFDHDIYDLHTSDWIRKAEHFDIIVGFPSSTTWELTEFRRKYDVLEKLLGKRCFPSPDHVDLYEDKFREAYLAEIYDLPFIKTYTSHDESDALRLIETLRYPVVSKVNPSSGSMGVELVRTEKDARRIVKQAFSRLGRATYTNHFRQKNYIYFQDFIPNDGHDIRAIVIGNRVFGYYRKVLGGDFRASGMNLVEMRGLPDAAMRLALRVNEFIKSPMLAVDMLHALDGNYYVIEYSPVCLSELPEDLHVNGVPGVYILGGSQSFHFEPGKYWLAELALREFLLKDYLPSQEALTFEPDQA
jgi:glutathione synthase/RimK-type ligase-like ATP-grasp enzyme